MEKLGPCKKFSGYPKDNGAKFLKEFESFAKLNELNDRDEEPRKLAAFHLHLQGPALTWYNGLHPDLDWNTIRDMFVEKYATIGWHNPSVVAECENFQNMVNFAKSLEYIDCRAPHNIGIDYGQWPTNSIKVWYDNYIK